MSELEAEMFMVVRELMGVGYIHSAYEGAAEPFVDVAERFLEEKDNKIAQLQKQIEDMS